MTRHNTASLWRDEIIQMRLEGKTSSEIAERTGLTTPAINSYVYREKLPTARDFDSLTNALLPNQRELLKAHQRKWGCTPAEAVVEILRDWLDETAAQEAAE